MKVSPELHRNVLLSVHRSLIGEISPEMRAIAFKLSSTEIHVILYGDLGISDEVVGDFDAGALTQVAADFPCPDRGDPIVTLECVRLGPTDLIPFSAEQVFVFARCDARFA